VAAAGVFAGNDGGDFYAIDRVSGDRIGRVDMGAPLYAGPVVVGDVVYAETTMGSVFAFDYGDASMLWDFSDDTPIRSLAVWGGRAVVGTDGGFHVLAASDSATNAGSTTRTASGSTSGGGTTSSGASKTGGDDSEERQRGFFSNGGDEPEFVSDAFNLTMLGFLLSVGGIVHQMLQGR